MSTKAVVQLLSCVLLMLGADSMRAQISPLPRSPSPASAFAGTRNETGASLQNRPTDAEPTTPRVSCQTGQLTIDAGNATLGSVLAAVSACIGVEINVPEDAATELTYVHLGPGPTREVLDTLLDSTPLNYAIQTSNSQPEKIASILLMARIKAKGDTQESIGLPVSTDISMTPARRAWLASVRTARAGVQMQDEPSNSTKAEPVLPSAPDNTERTPGDTENTVPGALSADPTQLVKENATATKAPATDAQSATAPAEPDTAATPNNQGHELQNKIGEMQQLFEQRKKMMANPTDISNPN